jgi:hypothetical protein
VVAEPDNRRDKGDRDGNFCKSSHDASILRWWGTTLGHAASFLTWAGLLRRRLQRFGRQDIHLDTKDAECIATKGLDVGTKPEYKSGGIGQKNLFVFSNPRAAHSSPLTAPSSTNGFDNFEAATQSMPCGNRTGRQIHLLAPKRNGIAGGK